MKVTLKPKVFLPTPETLIYLGNDASKCRAYGPGLVEGIMNQPAQFVVETPRSGKGKLEVKVEGPSSKAVVKVNDHGDGNYDVEYKPIEPGNYKVHVTLDGVHIPGNICTVDKQLTQPRLNLQRGSLRRRKSWRRRKDSNFLFYNFRFQRKDSTFARIIGTKRNSPSRGL